MKNNYARAQSKFTNYNVHEPMELMEFLSSVMPQASRTKLKSLLQKRIVHVDNTIITQYNFPLKPGMKVQISREKGKHEFHHNLLKIIYEDAYLIVVEKKEGCVLTQSRVGCIPCTTLTLDAIEQNLPILEYGKLEL